MPCCVCVCVHASAIGLCFTLLYYHFTTLRLYDFMNCISFHFVDIDVGVDIDIKYK